MAIAARQNLLVHTKLRRPRTVGQLVHRPRLSELLNRGATLPLTLVSAPAGYGKTTLISLWLDELGLPAAWYSLDESDDSLTTFVAYLAAALAAACPALGRAVQGALQSPAAHQPEQLADLFVGELDAVPGELLIVLDDYHAITAGAIHTFLAAVVQHAPPNVHFVLLVRADPPLKLARLRARQQILEVRAAQLRFTLDETGDLMQRILGALATERTVALFADRTEGWAAGIHLAATSMRDSSDAAGFAAGFARSSSPLIADYLVSEVLDQLGGPERDLLLSAAVLPRFCAPLLDAVMAQAVDDPVATAGAGNAYSGDAFIRHLRATNTFLVALDEEGLWHRFHHLFADILRHRLRLATDESTIAARHRAASRWFASQGLIDEAIMHALHAGEPAHAAHLVETYGDTVLNSDNWRALERWLALLPEEQKRRPGVLVAMAWLEQYRYRPQPILTLAQAAETALGQGDGSYTPAEVRGIEGRISALRALANMYHGNWADTLAFAEQALAAMQGEISFARGLTELAYIRAISRLGKPQRAVELAEVWLQYGAHLQALSLRPLLAMCGTFYDMVDLDQLRVTALSYRQLAEQAGRPLSVAWSNWMLGVVQYQRNDLAGAQRYFAEVVQHPYVAHTRTLIDSWTGLCLTLHAQGCGAEARGEAAALRTFLVGGGQLELVQMADVLEEWLDLLDRRATNIQDAFQHDLARQLGLDLMLAPALVWAIACIRSGEREKQVAAAAKLAEFRTLLAHDHLPRRLLEIELAEALLHAVAGDHKAALGCVRRAVTIAAPGGAVRCFVDSGPELIPYLHELAGMGVKPVFVAQIIAAYAAAGAPGGAPAPASLPLDQGNAVLGPDALTNRELDVLVLLDRRLSNKEIAATLVISPLTVKRHTRAIYSKLHVNSRRAAVVRARGLGLIPAGQTG
jgi:LuxR family maltose regulon positive regulatory protein